MSRFARVAIVNRGEAAMRFLVAARDYLDPVEPSLRLTTIALHTAAESDARFVREADEAVDLEALGVTAAGSPYLDLAVLEAALVAARAEAVWVGWGFVAERADFVDLCDRLGITFIGPAGDVMRRLGDKIAAKQLAAEADVPMAPWSGGPVDDPTRAGEIADAVGYPLMVKAAAGGGGRGIRRVDHPDQVADAVERAMAEGASAFGDPTVFMERVVSDARHVEVQIIADEHGTVWAPGVRDCSIQRRNQKVIEESHSTALTATQEDEVRAAAIRLALAAGYTNAGTVEFLYQPEDGQFAFLEVNTRLQVEHPVTEVTTGLDLVGCQIAVAQGHPLVGECPAPRGHAFEARLNAEDPANGFAPAAGRITALDFPAGAGVRVDSGVVAGDAINPDFDSMVAKIIAWGPDRERARRRLRRALQSTTALIDGGTTNKAFMLDLLDRDEVRTGRLTTGWVDSLVAGDEHRSVDHAAVALVAAAIAVHEERHALDLDRFLATAGRGRPEADAEVGHEIELRTDGGDHRLRVATGDAAGWFRIGDDHATVDVVRRPLDAHRSRLIIGGDIYRVTTQTSAADVRIEVDGVAHRFRRDDAGLVTSPAVSLVVAVNVAVGDVVEAGQRVAVIEAMKMETVVSAPIAGTVTEVHVTPNTQVDAGAPLVRLAAADPTEGDGDGDDGDAGTAPTEGPATPAALSSLMPAADGGVSARLDVLRAALLGYDIAPDALAATVAAHETTSLDDDPELRAAELGLLRVFADLCGVTRERRLAAEEPGRERRSPREHFNHYLRSLDPETPDLPERFLVRLREALAHYGIDDLTRSPALEDAVFRIHRAALGRRDHAELVATLLRRRADAGAPPAERDALRDTLDRVIAASQAQLPAIGNLARSVRHRVVDQPLVDATRRAIEHRTEQLIASLAADPTDDGSRDELVESPLPLLPRIAAVSGDFDPAASAAFIEVLTRRYYKIRDLDTVDRAHDPRPHVRVTYRHNGRRVGVLGVAATVDGLARATAAVGETLAAMAVDERVLECYVTPTATEAVAEATIVALEAQLDAVPDTVDRLSVVLVAPEGADRHSAPVLTWQRTGGALVERRAFRGIHPMIDRRLNLWRLANFELTRLPSAPDTHLFHAAATEQPADERLMAVAEVRDFTPLRDRDGNFVALPELERVLANCLDGIRQAQASEPAWQRLEWNRVMLYVWPPVSISPDEMNAVAKRLVPMTAGLGLDQVMVQGRLLDEDTGETTDVVVRIGYRAGAGLTVEVTEPPTEPMAPLDDYARRVIQCRRRGLVYPYELVPSLIDRGAGTGTFTELDLVGTGTGADVDAAATDIGGGASGRDELVAVSRPAGQNRAGIIVGEVTTPTATYPEGMRRVAIFGDPTRSMGSIAEAECRRLLAALDHAETNGLPVEWFALSAGARIAMDSGSENLDWVAAVLRRIVEFTQRGGEINVIVAGVNVGAQPYWNAESTMLMHTRGILVMTPDATMVLTGKQAIDFSGGVSAEDNIGIGGYERVMGPNGQSQFWAPDLDGAIDVLFRYYDLAYAAPGEHGPRRHETTDPADRDVSGSPHDVDAGGFETVGEIFSVAANPDRKKPFDIRSVMRAVIDADHTPLERWAEMVDADGAVVFESRLGGRPATVIGVESRPLDRSGLVPTDGPAQWSAGTLFPLSSKKVARAINAASGNRPVVVLANLSGFDGSPESLRRLQLEYGAEIGRSIVNFDGRFVLCVISRYHGGAFVVFSGRLNDDMVVLAVDGARASVIGGAPAAAVVFTREVNARTQSDDRVRAAEGALAAAGVGQRARCRAELDDIRSAVRSEVLGAVAAEFDAVHSVERAKAVGSVQEIIAAAELRPALIDAIDPERPPR